MLYFRNTYKNCKIMILYAILSISFLILSFFMLTLAALFEDKLVWFIVGAIASFLFSMLNLFLLRVKNNDYKLKYYFQLKKFKTQLKEYLNVLNPSKHQKRYIKRVLKDNFLRFGDLNTIDTSLEPNPWNNWIENQVAFNYGNSKFAEKLSYLTYCLYNASASGSGFEGFFQYLSYEPFDKNELKSVLFRDNFFSKNFQEFLTSVIDEFCYEKQDEFYARYEEKEDKILFTFEEELQECCLWLAYNEQLLRSCADLYDNFVNENVIRVFLSKDYREIYYILQDSELKYYHVYSKVWGIDNFNGYWTSNSSFKGRSFYSDPEVAYQENEYILKNCIEISL